MLSYSPVPSVPSLRIATDPDGVAALRRLADILTRTAHPSVIAIESTRFETARAEVVLATVVGTTLNSSLSIEALMKGVASAAAAIAYLHDQSIAVGAVNAETFVIRKDGSAVLCGLDHAIENPDVKDKQQDIRELAQFATSCMPPLDPLRDRINNVEASPLRESFVRILEQAEKNELDARQLSEKLRHALWFDSAPIPRNELKSRTIHWPTRRRTTATMFTVIAALCVVAGTRMQSNAASSPPDTTPALSCELRTGTTVDTDTDGCPDSVTFGEGVVTINNDRYAVGTAGDELAIGEWNCDERATLALLRPATGEIFIFDEWPQPGATASPRRLTVNAPSNGLHAERSEGCDLLSVSTATGPQQHDARKAVS